MDVALKSKQFGVRPLSDAPLSASTDIIQPQDTPQVELSTLGSAELRVRFPDRGVTAVLGPGKPLGLITYLALIPSRSTTRDHLLDLFWSDLEPEGGRHALRQTLWYLKRRLGITLLTSAVDTVALALPVRSDRDAFISAAESDDLERAVVLYAGDFLPDFALPGGAEFEHWADLERERLRDTFVRTAERLTRAWLSVPRPREAVVLARRARDTAPNAEFTWRLLLEALISARDHLAATVEADALERRLREDGTEPEPATRALLRAARRLPDRADPIAPAEAIRLTSELVGREAEFSGLLGAWESSRARRSHHIHVSGKPGIGKSRLMGDFEARLRARRARIASVRARPGDRQSPFALLAQLAAELGELSGANGVAPEVAAVLVALNPRLSSVFNAKVAQAREPDLVRMRSLALSELIAAVAEDGAVAIFVDDVHWADEDSQRALGSALGRLSSEAVLAVTSSRQDFLPSFDLSAAKQMMLAPLTAAQVGAMVASLGAVPDGLAVDELSRKVQGATHGSPLLVLELIGSLLDRGTISLQDGQWTVRDHDALARAISSGSAIYQRLASLPFAEQRVILAASLAGVPLELETLARAVGIDAASLEAQLNELEKRGFMARTTAGWQTAHDEIGEAMADLSPLEERAHAHRRLARALADLRDDPVQLIRAARQYIFVNDDEGLADAFTNWLALERRRGDARSAARLASDFIGEGISSPRVKRLAGRAPFFVRHRMNGWYAVTAAAAVIAAVALWVRPAAAPPRRPDAVLLARTIDGGKSSFYRVAFTREEFSRADALDLQQFGTAADSAPVGARRFSSIAPDGLIVSEREMPDSGGIDLFVTDLAGTSRRLTSQPGDDVHPDWSPDGKFVVFMTARWDSLSHYALALLDVHSLAVRRLTTGSYSDNSPRWSPDGTRIAFERRSWSGEPESLCFVSPAGTVMECVRDPSNGSIAPLGWFDSHRLVLRSDRRSPQETVFRIYDVDDAAWVTLRTYASAEAELSSDGKWMLCRCADAGGRRKTRVWPVESPTMERELRSGPVSEVELEARWMGPPPHAPYLDSISIDVPSRGVPLNATHLLHVRGLDARGAPIDVPRVTWHTPDSSVASVTPAGLLVPKRTGVVRVTADANGWRSASAALRVVAPASHALLSADWKEPLGHAFTAFGDPAPLLVDDKRFGTAMWNHGDGSFTSGVYSRSEYDASAGLGMEAWISVPQTISQWQVIDVSLSSGLDASALARWDHRTGGIPWSPAPGWSRCGLAAPADEGPESRDMARFSSAIDYGNIDVPALSTGRWVLARVQLFPDGRCGYAIDGVPRAMTAGPVDLKRPFRVVLHGNSYKTTVLVGPVSVWSGVRDDIDWRAIGTSKR